MRQEGDLLGGFVGGFDFDGGQFNERFNAPRQERRVGEGHTRRRAGALRPAARPDGANGVPYLYKGAEARELLFDLGASERDPSGTYVVDYVNPATGGPTMPSIACRLHRIPGGTETRRKRTTPNTIFHVVEGKGQTAGGPRTLAWTKGDLFVVPGWTWHKHIASDGDAVLFSMGDDPVYEALGILRTELA